MQTDKINCSFTFTLSYIQCARKTKQQIFSKIYTSSGSPIRTGYMVSFASSKSMFYCSHLRCIRIELQIQYIPRNMHTVFALLCFVVVIHWVVSPYPSGLLHWHCGNLTIAPVPAKQPWWIWINTSCEFIMNDCITTTKQSTTKPCAYFLGYTVYVKSFYIPWFNIDGLNQLNLCNGVNVVFFSKTESEVIWMRWKFGNKPKWIDLQYI